MDSENKRYWSSLADYENDPAVIKAAEEEFQSSPIRDGAEGGDRESTTSMGRRDFLKLMAASSAMASTACLQRPMHKILPYVNQPDDVMFGVPNFYASTCGDCSAGCGILVKTREGRPIKLEGNPDHPMNKGALCARGQASILNLYDPDRLKNPSQVFRGEKEPLVATWTEMDKLLGSKLAEIKAKGGSIRVLSSTVISPSVKKLIGEFLNAFPQSKHVVYEPLNEDAIAHAQQEGYGAGVLPRYRFENAQYIVSIDADFLGTWISPVEFTKQFSKNRKLSETNKTMTRLVAFESAMTVTGANADTRYGIRPSDAAPVALAIANELAFNHHLSGADADAQAALRDYSVEKVSATTGLDSKVLKAVAAALAAHQGSSLVVAGSSQSQSEASVTLQLAVSLINSLLKNDGVTVDTQVSPSNQNAGSTMAMSQLLEDMASGKVDALLIYRSNPAYSWPDTDGLKAALKKVPVTISFNDHLDETTTLCDYACPDNHYLESWSDAEPQKALLSVTQPAIRPLHNTRAFTESLLAFNRSASLGIKNWSGFKDFHAYLQDFWKSIYKEYAITVPFELFWESLLRQGVFDGVAKKNNRKVASGKPRSFKGSALKASIADVATKKGSFQTVFYSNVALHDGTHANNAWLQELPDPISRIAWDNYASVSYATAKNLHLEDGDVVQLTWPQGKIELPVHVQPGLHDEVVTVALGYGRTSVGPVGNKIGHNMFPHAVLAKTKLGTTLTVYAGLPTELKKTGARYKLASVQEYTTMEGRPVIKDATFKEFAENPSAGNEEKEENPTIWTPHEYKGYRWGMTIDLTSCTGCHACVIACQSENNIPVVGKDGVARGRVMHWIRIDRYYTGTPDNPQTAHQPMLCQQCENAPCETVCPVLATTHDDEGLNQQTYNRCVGTRYCANNCPYKVRRFNWFNYNYDKFTGTVRYPLGLAQNPEVSVRSRGVMEKCTFCVQRIHDVKNRAEDENRSVREGEIKTACQQTCPADAIRFGDINNKANEVAKDRESARGYFVMNELNTRPSITYLTKIRNTENV